MADPTQIKFSYQELATLMLKAQGIKEGLWAIYVKFGIVGVNAGPSEDSQVPTALVPLHEMGIQRVDVKHPLAVDASKI